MADIPEITLSNGMRAIIEPDRYRDGSFVLVVDGTPQSEVNPEDPTDLSFEYVERIGHVIDLLGSPGQPITAVHLGAGALTLPRYVEATRPGSRQQVIEIEPRLVDFVREHLPLPRNLKIRFRYGDAREVVGKLPPGLVGSVDLVVVDIFAGARTPAHVTTLEFYTQVAALLSPTGVIAVNVADGPGLTFARGVAATLSSVVGHVAALAETQILKGRRFGNIVLIGSPAPLPIEWLPRLLAAGPHPSKSVSGSELKSFIGKAPIVTDDTAVQSPPPGRTVFQIGRN
jgi:spermidine synthase